MSPEQKRRKGSISRVAPGRPAVGNQVADAQSARLSRRLLLEAIGVLEPFRESLTVIGAHAVFARVQDTLPDLAMQATSDADLAVNPAFVTSQPTILSLMEGAGLAVVSPDRPGIYGYQSESGLPQSSRTTIDLLVPEAYAGAGRRGARIAGQRNAATRAEGIELAIYDRSSMRLSPLPGDRDLEPVEVMVAGHAALLVAKAFKIRDRVRAYASRPHRLRQKDSVDIGLLMLTCDPAEAAATMAGVCSTHPETAEIAAEAAELIVAECLRDESGLVRLPMVRGVEQLLGPESARPLDSWLQVFDEASRPWREGGSTLRRRRRGAPGPRRPRRR